MSGKLYVVPTPVGNLDDMTFRAVKVLQEADLILAEDTRTSGVLLKHFDIHTPMKSHHKFNEHVEAPRIAERVLAGETIALISGCGNAGNLRSGVHVEPRMPQDRRRRGMLAGPYGICPGSCRLRIALRQVCLRRLPPS